jgi:predicted outer membrane repeat protein
MFIGNSSAHDGGAVKLNSNFGHSNISNSLFINNTCDNLGAAIYAKTRNAYDVTIDHCTLDANTSATPAEGQVYFGQAAPTHTLSHSIISNGGSTYALANTSFCDVVSHVDSWGNGVNNLGWNAATGTDTIHVDPIYNCFSFSDTCYAAKAGKCRNTTDASYMGWVEYVPPDFPFRAPPTANPALYQDAFYQDLYAVSDTVCCHANHWDMIVPDLAYAGRWSVFPYGAKSKLADGINVKVTLASSNDGWSETYFISAEYGTAIHWKNEFVLEQLFNTAVDTVAVQAAFSTCAADSTLQYQFIMEGW